MPNVTQPTEHKLTDGEKTVLANLGSAVAQRKLAIYDLNLQLEQAQRERDTCQALFTGAVAAIAESHGLPGGQLAADFSVIRAQK